LLGQQEPAANASRGIAVRRQISQMQKQRWRVWHRERADPMTFVHRGMEGV